MLLRTLGWIYVLLMTGSAAHTVWCEVMTECKSTRLYLMIFVSSLLSVPTTALAAVWIRTDLSRSRKWEWTRQFMIGWGAFPAALRFLTTGGLQLRTRHLQ